MKVDEIRDRFLRFFEKRGHTIYPSDALVPQNDPSLLFTGAGMNQFKDMFLGRGKLPFKRATTCQKCVRTGDIERVGKTASHHTFFEMLGNFSFGDYFKREAIAWAWEFLTVELKIDPQRLYVTVYKDDDEAYALWRDEIHLPEARIFRFDEKDNFWPAEAPSKGPNGVCGPCSEIYYDRGADQSCGRPECNVGCSCNRYFEVWNLVFTQFDRKDGGVLDPLPNKNIDTGMGLERIASVLQGVTTNFDIDTFKTLIHRIADLVGRRYEARSEEGARMRRIADHIRAVCFMISDGVLPANDGRGYVERKVLRRAVRDGMALGVKQPLLFELVPTVAEVMKAAYPELGARRDHLARIIKGEEEKTHEVFERGTALLEKRIGELRAAGTKVFPGEELFHLYDTLGYMVEWAESLVEERGLKVDRVGFEKAMERQRELARAASGMTGAVFDTGPIAQIKTFFKHCEFSGYDKLEDKGKVVAIIADDKLVPQVAAPADVAVVLDRTPLYGESGGQVGDHGVLRAHDVEAQVVDAKRVEDYLLHVVRLKKGHLAVGQELTAVVDPARRAGCARNHTATHLLQWALREVLGPSVEQHGSLVAPDRLRFDFSHFASLTRDELRRVEELANARIAENEVVKVGETDLETAKKEGALMFFGEKYGAKVRLVKLGDYSKELCGGTHLKRVGNIGYLRIASEASIASGVRRIEALTGGAAVLDALADRVTLAELGDLLGCPPEKLPERVRALQDEMKALRQEVEKARRGQAAEAAKSASERGKVVGGIRIVAERFEGKGPDDLRTMADNLRKGKEPVAALLIGTQEGKVNLVVALSKDAAGRGLDAVALVREVAPLVGGRGGGGRNDLANAGGKDATKVADALAAFTRQVETRLA